MLHYNKHYKNYVDKLNDTIKKYPKLYSCSLTDLLSNLDCLPDSASQIIKNNGGGIYNHEFFFSIMTNRKTYPSEELKRLSIEILDLLMNLKRNLKKLH